MCDRRHEPYRLGATGVALGLALGLLLMHGLDARAAGEGHGLMTSPSALVSEIRAAVPVPGADGSVVTPVPERSPMHHLCFALIEALAFAFAGLLAIWRGRRAVGAPSPADRLGAPLLEVARWRAPPEPRVALCVSLC